MREILLHTQKTEYQDKVAKVDDEHYEMLTGLDDNGKPIHWYIRESSVGTLYARATGNIIDGIHGPYMSRIILNILHDPIIDSEHRNHDGLDNQISTGNLRHCISSQNMQNSNKRKSYRGKDTTSKYRGISWYKRDQKWRAQLKINRESVYQEYFTNEIAAARAYDVAALQYHDPEFRTLNFPDMARAFEINAL